jgi:hypothetical protein
VTGIEISLNGADSSSYEKATRTSTRLVPFPDGVTRHITLKNCYWEALDWRSKTQGWPSYVLPTMAYETVRKVYAIMDGPPFEEGLRIMFFHLISITAADKLTAREQTIANGNPVTS